MPSSTAEAGKLKSTLLSSIGASASHGTHTPSFIQFIQSFINTRFDSRINGQPGAGARRPSAGVGLVDMDALVLLGSGHLSACSCSPGTVASNPPAPQRPTLGWYPEAQPKPHSSTFQACCQHLLPCATPLCLKEPKRVASVICN